MSMLLKTLQKAHRDENATEADVAPDDTAVEAIEEPQSPLSSESPESHEGFDGHEKLDASELQVRSDDIDVLLETDANNNAQNYYVYGLDLISRIDASNTTHYYHDDFRGSVIALTDTNETITHKYQYTDFGAITQIEEANYNPYRYVGKHGIQFEENGLYFMRARYYDAHTGRFLTEDPIWATNLYPYAGNNPVMNIDKTGGYWETPWDIGNVIADAVNILVAKTIELTTDDPYLKEQMQIAQQEFTTDLVLDTGAILTPLPAGISKIRKVNKVTKNIDKLPVASIKEFTDDLLGISGKLLGNSGSGTQGLLNNKKNLEGVALGWSRHKGKFFKRFSFSDGSHLDLKTFPNKLGGIILKKIQIKFNTQKKIFNVLKK